MLGCGPKHDNCWFGNEDNDSSSGTSDNDDSNWSEVDRRKANKEKERKRKEKRKARQYEAATKASGMVGLGPIDRETIEHFESSNKTSEAARIQAVREFLTFHLEFNEKELDEMEIEETKAGKDVIYVAMRNKDMVREIYVRKAESGNDDINLRNYVPPGFYNRYMMISDICKRMRETDRDIKTQVRFGVKDVEVYTKVKGGNEGYREVNLKDLMRDEEQNLPDFEDKIPWRKQGQKPMRRKINYKDRHAVIPSRRDRTSDPASRKDNTKTGDPTKPRQNLRHPSMIRQHSTSTETMSKKSKTTEEDMETSGPETSGEKTDTDSEPETYNTLRQSNQKTA